MIKNEANNTEKDLPWVEIFICNINEDKDTIYFNYLGENGVEDYRSAQFFGEDVPVLAEPLIKKFGSLRVKMENFPKKRFVMSIIEFAESVAPISEHFYQLETGVVSKRESDKHGFVNRVSIPMGIINHHELTHGQKIEFYKRRTFSKSSKRWYWVVDSIV